MNCNGCGAQIPDAALQCPTCGRETRATLERDVEDAVRTAAREVKKATRQVVREAKPLVEKAVAVTRGAVRGAIKGAHEAAPPTSTVPPPPPPPGATGDVKPRREGETPGTENH